MKNSDFNKRYEKVHSRCYQKKFEFIDGRKPIIASDCGPQRKLIESFNCGLIFSNQDELVNGIIQLSNNKKLQKEMGDNGYRALLENYNSERFDKVLTDVYKQYSGNNSINLISNQL